MSRPFLILNTERSTGKLRQSYVSYRSRRFSLQTYNGLVRIVDRWSKNVVIVENLGQKT